MSKKDAAALISVIMIGAWVYKYANRVYIAVNDANPENVASEVKAISGFIEACEITESVVHLSNDPKISRNTLRALIRLKDHPYLFPLNLMGDTNFPEIKKICSERPYIAIEYTSMNKKLEKIHAYHVNQLTVPEEGIVVDAFRKF